MESIQPCTTYSHFGALTISYTLPCLAYSFTPESSEQCDGKVPCPRTLTSKQCPNVESTETWYIYLKTCPKRVLTRTADHFREEGIIILCSPLMYPAKPKVSTVSHYNVWEKMYEMRLKSLWFMNSIILCHIHSTRNSLAVRYIFMSGYDQRP